jgi:ubiquinone/menaquinone biosynthesis C-methylase UbiE
VPLAGDTDDKRAVHEYWNSHPCEAPRNPRLKRFSREYFEAIEAARYDRHPAIMAFAQFPRYHGRRVLEVGVGVGTDFVQWVRCGADAYGVDLTREAIAHVEHRLAVYGLHACEVRIADCEDLPYRDDSFDLVYSWGVIHHTPNVCRALEEIVRVCRPGGICKLMVYNRHSLAAFYVWVRRALLSGHPWYSFSRCIACYVESPGTKAFSYREIREMLSRLPVSCPAESGTVRA